MLFWVLYSGKFLRGAFFESRAVNVKNLKTGRNSHAQVFHMQSLWWVSVSSRIRIGYMHWIALINQTQIRISEYAWIKTHTHTVVSALEREYREYSSEGS